MNKNIQDTATLQKLDAAHHLHPFTHGDELNKKGALIITRANGVFLQDSEGNDYLDGMSGLWCVNLGYGRKELARVAAAQMEQLPYYNTFFQTSHPPVIELSATLATLAPGALNHVFYAGSGSEANDTNMRLARHYWAAKDQPNKKVIISRKNAYHGSTMAGASLGGMKPMHAQGGLPVADVIHIEQPYWYGEGGDLSPEEFGLQRARLLEAEINRLGADSVAAFIAEPVQGAGGVIIPPSTYWPEIQRICNDANILLIADEVICGFGRTGNWFGSQTFDIKPDIMTIAKGLSSGYQPIGGSMVSDEIANVVNAAGSFNHGYTYSGHPVACAVASENLRLLAEEKVVETVRNETAPYLESKWSQLADHPLVGEARICGMMGALELTPNKAARAPFAGEEGHVGTMCRVACYESGLVMRAVDDKMIISPPLVITKPEIDTLIERAVQALDKTYKQVKSAGLLKSA